MLKLSKNSGLTDIISTDGSNPLTTTHPTTGSTVEAQEWLFNSSTDMSGNAETTAHYYKGITIDPTDSTSTDESTWVYLAPDNGGVPGTYLAAGVALTMADIGSSGNVDRTGHPFWYKVVAPAVSGSQNKTDIKLTVNAQEYAV